MNTYIHLNFGTGEIFEFQSIHKAIKVGKEYIASGFDCDVVRCSNADDWAFLENYFQRLSNSY